MNYIDIHTHNPIEQKGVYSILNLFPENEMQNRWVSIGLHPWYIDPSTAVSELSNIEKKVGRNNVVAVGEAGLDKLTQVDFDLQKEVFDKQAQIAAEAEKPLIIHCVKAFGELLQMKKKWPRQLKCVVHGFRGKDTLAKQLIGAGFYLSFGKPILFQANLKKTLTNIPFDRIFLESDDADVQMDTIYTKLAEILAIQEAEVKEQIATNFKTIFNV